MAIAFVIELSLGTGEKLVVIALRGLFFFAPLLLGPTYLDRHLFGRLERLERK